MVRHTILAMVIQPALNLGDIFAQPKAAGVFMPGLPSAPGGSRPAASPDAAALRAAYQQRQPESVPSTYYAPSVAPEGVGNGHHSEGNHFPGLGSPVPPTPQRESLEETPGPTELDATTPEESTTTPALEGHTMPAENHQPPAAAAAAKPEASQPPAKTKPVSVYDNGMYWKLLAQIYDS